MSANFLFSEIEVPSCYGGEFQIEVEAAVTRINQDLDQPDYDVDELRKLLEINGVGDYSDKDEYSDEAVKDVVRGAVEEVSKALVRSYGSISYRTERGRCYAITGGMSYGDPPSDEAEYFDTIIAAGYSFVDHSDRCSTEKACSRRESFVNNDADKSIGYAIDPYPRAATVETWTFCPFCGEHLEGMRRKTTDNPESQF